MLIGELINTSRDAVRIAVESRDDAFIRELAEEQEKAGADYVDVNCGSMIGQESEAMRWLVKIVQEVVSVPLCIDSPSLEVLELGLASSREKSPMINSISAETRRFREIIPLVTKYGAKVIALCMDDGGIPASADDRVKIAGRLVTDLSQAGVALNDIFLDPLVQPISTSEIAGREVLRAVDAINNAHPDAHLVSGLSNVSFGLPSRKLLNRTFLVQLMSAGMDSFLVDPLDRDLMGAYYASAALLGIDEFGIGYIEQFREGAFE